MGCCASQKKPDFRNNHLNNTHKDIQPIWNLWNTELFQAKKFSIDQANIRLAANKPKPYRIVSKFPFPEAGRFQLKIRYVSHKVSSFSIGIFHFGSQAPTQNIRSIGETNAVRLYVSKNEGELRSQGQNVFFSKDWRTKQQDTIIMTVDMSTDSFEWKKQNTMDSLSHKIPLPRSFANKQLFVQLIMYEPETQLNIQV